MKEDVSDAKGGASWWVLIAVTLLTNLGTFAGSYMASLGTTETNYLDRLKHTEERMTKMEERTQAFRRAMLKENDELRSINIKVNIENSALKVKLQKENDRRELLQSFLDSLPFPAWIKTKRESDGAFVMEMINDAYVMRYQVSKSRYEGYTDYDIHGSKLGEAYAKSDNYVLKHNRYKTFNEVVGVNGKMIPLVVWKFIISADGESQGVGGVSFDKLELLHLITGETPPTVKRDAHDKNTQ